VADHNRWKHTASEEGRNNVADQRWVLQLVESRVAAALPVEPWASVDVEVPWQNPSALLQSPGATQVVDQLSHLLANAAQVCRFSGTLQRKVVETYPSNRECLVERPGAAADAR